MKLEEATALALQGKLEENSEKIVEVVEETSTPIWKLEETFMNAFESAIGTIQAQDLTLREVLKFGFNNVELSGVRGYEEEDFTEDLLDIVVDFDYWEEDADGYRCVMLTKKF